MKLIGQLDRLIELIEKRGKESEGATRQTWLLAQSAVDWWEGDKEASLAALEQVVAITPADMDLVSLRSKALAAHGDFKQALAALAPLRVPFGSAAKSLEQARLQLAQRAQNDEVAKQAALRLFAMRLESNEQVQLSQTLRRLGLIAQGQQLDQKAELMARSNPQMMYHLMIQYAQTDPAKAATLAKSILQHAKRGAVASGTQNNTIRNMALRQLQQAGELDKKVAQAEEQLAAAPGSAALLDDLVELYSVSNEDEKLLAVMGKVIAMRPEDFSLRIQAAQILMRRRRYPEGGGLTRANLGERAPTRSCNSFPITSLLMRAPATSTTSWTD